MKKYIKNSLFAIGIVIFGLFCYELGNNWKHFRNDNIKKDTIKEMTSNTQELNLEDSLKYIIIGEWTDNQGSMIFEEDGSFIIIFQNVQAGGENFRVKGKDVTMEYKFNFDKNPYWLDVVRKEKGKNKTSIDTVMKAIAKIEHNRLILRLTDKKKRPEYFDGNKDYTLILYKK